MFVHVLSFFKIFNIFDKFLKKNSKNRQKFFPLKSVIQRSGSTDIRSYQVVASKDENL